jgi:hypothetical protein
MVCINNMKILALLLLFVLVWGCAGQACQTYDPSAASSSNDLCSPFVFDQVSLFLPINSFLILLCNALFFNSQPYLHIIIFNTKYV